MSVFHGGGQGLASGTQGRKNRVLPLSWERFLKKPGVRSLLKVGLTGLMAFCLAPCAMGSLQLPVLVGFLFSLETGWTTLFAGAMGALGGAVFWQGAEQMEIFGQVLCALITMAVFSPGKLWKRLWAQSFLCLGVTVLCAVGMCLLLGDKPDLLALGIRAVFASLAHLAFSPTWKGKREVARDASAAFLVLGLCQVRLPWDMSLGFFLGALLNCAGERIALGLLCGLAMELSGICAVPMSAVLGISSLTGKHLRSPYGGAVLPVALTAAWSVATGDGVPGLWLSLLLGGFAGMLVKPGKKQAPQAPTPEEHRLMAVSRVMGQLAGVLGQEEGVPPSKEGGEEQRLRRQYELRLSESRKALTRQYESLSRFCMELAMPQRSPAPCRFQAEVGFCALGAGGSTYRGDRAAWFSAPQNRFYVLLCDGMGTGKWAAKASREAVNLLRGLLQAGLEPGEALQTLNDSLVLRDLGGLSTADLLELRLDNGWAYLYKWGGAPSYYKRGERVQRIGAAAPPPGVGIGEEYHPEVLRLPMHGGQVLVMVSDGVAGEDLPGRIQKAPGDSLEKLAEYLVKTGEGLPRDDQTAVAVCLDRLPAGPS